MFERREGVFWDVSSNWRSTRHLTKHTAAAGVDQEAFLPMQLRVGYVHPEVANLSVGVRQCYQMVFEQQFGEVTFICKSHKEKLHCKKMKLLSNY